MTAIVESEVQERPDPMEEDDGYAKTNKIFTFPILWDFDRCIKWCVDRNYNAFVLGTTEDGRHEFTCAYSWRLSYFLQFGEHPKD